MVTTDHQQSLRRLERGLRRQGHHGRGALDRLLHRPTVITICDDSYPPERNARPKSSPSLGGVVKLA
jgi:hypothetical protein